MRHPLDPKKLQTLREEIEPLTTGFDLLPDHVIVTDEHANIIYANKAVELSSGFKHDALVGKTPGDLWGGNMPREFYERMWHTIKVEKRPFVDEVRNVRKDGTEYWQELRISPVLADDGEVRFFIGIEPVITDKKRLEDENRDMYELTKRMNEFMVGRELKIDELKKQIASLQKEIEQIQKKSPQS